jgi:DNA-binding transcriptional ArsR family regulator
MKAELQSAFRALADPTRRAILMQLSKQDLSIREVAASFEYSRSAIQKHLAVLEEGRLISVKRSGRERINHFEPLALKEVTDWLGYFDRFWDERLGNLKHAIENRATTKDTQ